MSSAFSFTKTSIVNMKKRFWLHIIPIFQYATVEPTTKFLLLLLTGPHPAGAAPLRGYVSWEQLSEALQGVRIHEAVLKEAASDAEKGMAFSIPDVELDEKQIRALGLDLS
jgi:hypothetical protein